MERRNFIKNTLMAAGGLMIGGVAIDRFITSKELTENQLPTLIEKVHNGTNKNVLVIMSAGSRLGNTDRLTDAYIKGLVESDHTVIKIYLGSMRIEGCRGCGVCQRLAHRCAIKDDMQDIYPLFAECNRVVISSPLYFWTITARAKAFIERLYAISIEDKYPSKESVLLMTAGDDKETTFDQPKQYFHILNQALGWINVGQYYAGGCTGCEKLAREIDNIHLENVYKMGLELNKK